MASSTKQDKLLFFGITLITLMALTFIINYGNPIAGFGVEYFFLFTFVLASLVTILKFNFEKIAEKCKSANTYFISGIIWSAFAAMKWIKYFDKNNFDWIMAAIFTLVAAINWVSYFRNSNKISD